VAETSPAHSDALLDNDVVRVQRWTLPPGSSMGRHRHEFPYVVVPITGGRLTFKDGQGDNPVDLIVGDATFRAAGIEHEVLNLGEATVVFVETEITA
jgi:quercetin dioxygenase-like cupin family protein